MAFVAIYFFHVPFPLIVVSAAVIGLLGAKILPQYFRGENAHPADVDLASKAVESAETIFACALEDFGNLDRDLVVAACARGIFLGTEHTIFREGIFFSKAAVVTFGGAYAVLPYVSQQAVEHFIGCRAADAGWLGLAETTPGPLIMVLQFVGFLGAWNHPGNLPPLLSATFGALVTTWTTFVPCFLWVFLGAPYIEKLRGEKQLTAALSTVTAAVVGVILNLAVWFGVHVFSSHRKRRLVCRRRFAIAFVGMLRWKWNIVPSCSAADCLD